MTRIPRVFVSSTFNDLKEQREKIMRHLLKNNCFPVGMESFPATGRPPMAHIKTEIDTCDIYILVIAGRYGTRGPNGISYTEEEYLYAKERGIPILAFPKLAPDYESIEDKESLKKFAKQLENGLTSPWKDDAALIDNIAASLKHEIERQSNFSRDEDSRLDILKKSREVILISYNGYHIQQHLSQVIDSRGRDASSASGCPWNRIVLIRPNEDVLHLHAMPNSPLPVPKKVFGNFQLASETLSNLRPEAWDIREYDGILPFEGIWGRDEDGRDLVHVRDHCGDHRVVSAPADREEYRKKFEVILNKTRSAGKLVVWGRTPAASEPLSVDGIVADSKWRNESPRNNHRHTIFLSLVLLHGEYQGEKVVFLQRRTFENTGGDPGFLSLISSKLVDQDFAPLSESYRQARDSYLLKSTPEKLNEVSQRIRKEACASRLGSAHRTAALREIESGLGISESEVELKEFPELFGIRRRVGDRAEFDLSVRLFSLEIAGEILSRISEARPGSKLEALDAGQLLEKYKMGIGLADCERLDPRKQPLNHFLQLRFKEAILPLLQSLGFVFPDFSEVDL